MHVVPCDEMGEAVFALFLCLGNRQAVGILVICPVLKDESCPDSMKILISTNIPQIYAVRIKNVLYIPLA